MKIKVSLSRIKVIKKFNDNLFFSIKFMEMQIKDWTKSIVILFKINKMYFKIILFKLKRLRDFYKVLINIFLSIIYSLYIISWMYKRPLN